MLLKDIRKNKMISQAELAKQIGVSRSTVSMWEIGASQPDNDLLLKISKVLNVSIDELLENTTFNKPDESEHIFNNDNIFPIKIKKVPLLGDIACGQPIFADEMHGEFVLISEDIDADFCLKAKGDSMTGARINDGDIVFIKQQDEVLNGQIAAVRIGDEATLKRVYFYKEKGKLVLNPENPNFEPLVYVGEELTEVQILGRAVAFQSIVK